MDPRDRIEILKVVPMPPGGALRAFVSVSLDGKITIHDNRVIMQEGKTPWVSPPQREVERDGVKKYYPVVEIQDRALKAAIDEKILDAWRRADTGE